MNNAINAHPLERKERIAFDLMLKIAHCDTRCMPKEDSNSDSKQDSTSDDVSVTMNKEYWLSLYADCLSTVQQKKCKK